MFTARVASESQEAESAPQPNFFHVHTPGGSSKVQGASTPSCRPDPPEHLERSGGLRPSRGRPTRSRA
eukprot:7045813-Prymnesium_polylepis.1